MPYPHLFALEAKYPRLSLIALQKYQPPLPWCRRVQEGFLLSQQSLRKRLLPSLSRIELRHLRRLRRDQRLFEPKANPRLLPHSMPSSTIPR